MSIILEPPTTALAALAAGGTDGEFDPVQFQHLLFLIDQQIPGWVNGPHFAFAPGPFGPFAENVKDLFVELFHAGYLHRKMTDAGSLYALTPLGLAQGADVLSQIESCIAAYLQELFLWVCALDFRQRLSVLQMHYPDMVVERPGTAKDWVSPDSAQRRVVKNYLNQTASNSLFMQFPQLTDMAGSDSFHDQVLRALREDQQESIPPVDIWTAVGDRLRKAMALHACGDP